MIAKDEALLLLDKLCECERVRCCLSFSSFGLWLEGKLRRDGDLVSLSVPDLNFDFRLTGDVGFEYADSKDIPGGNKPDGDIVSGLAIALPLRFLLSLSGAAPPTRVKIMLFELSD